MSIRSINEIVDQANDSWFDAFHYDKHKVITYFLAIRLGVHLLVMMSWVMYMVTLNKFNKAMIAFHTFLNNYRQTPRSRFIRKYKPGLEPLYEELSAFERSQYSSYTQSVNEKTNSIENSKGQNEFNFS